MDLGSLCALWCCLSIEVDGTLSNVIGYGTTILLANAWLSLLPCDVFLPEMLSILFQMEMKSLGIIYLIMCAFDN